MPSVGLDRLWTNQSCTMNWIHAAASRLRIRRRLELVTRHQLPADHARVRHEQVGGVGKHVLERDVAAEAAAAAPIAGYLRSL